jgi:cephalosporin hydroxylase
MKDSKLLKDISKDFFEQSVVSQYSYNFNWMSRPIIQYPQDVMAVQEIIWSVKPDLIIETGIAHGGSLIYSASMLALIDYCEAKEKGKLVDPNLSQRKVIGIDIDIREHNRLALDNHPMRHMIELIEGSSIDKKIFEQVQKLSSSYNKIMVFLDSHHTNDHVLSELEFYSNFVTKNSYCIVFDTVIEDLPAELSSDRPWGPGNSPKTAVKSFLKNNKNFEIDKNYQEKYIITVAPDGFLKRV